MVSGSGEAVGLEAGAAVVWASFGAGECGRRNTKTPSAMMANKSNENRRATGRFIKTV
jgi:hypothetical protein